MQKSIARSAEANSRSFFYSDPLRQYAEEIGQTPLLTRKEEVELSKLIEKGGKKGADARERLIKANLRLVVKIARDYEGLGVAVLDLISEGNIGLMKAAEAFKWRKNVKFSTYSAWWIKQRIKRCLADDARTVRIPVHAVQKIWNINKKRSALHEELGRDPTPDEIGAELGLTGESVEKLLASNQRILTFDQSNTDEPDALPLSETLADPSTLDPSTLATKGSNVELLHQLISLLHPREIEIVKRRFGLADGSGGETLEEIGDSYGVTRERIRQIENVALRKLRARLRSYENGSMGQFSGNVKRPEFQVPRIKRRSRQKAICRTS